MKNILLILIILYSRQGLAKKRQFLAIEPEVGVQLSKWTQPVSTSDMSGTMGGNSYGGRYGGNLVLRFGEHFFTGYGYKVNQLAWTYQSAPYYEGDNEWKKNTKAKEHSHEAFLGLRFKRFMVIGEYVFASHLSFTDYYRPEFTTADYDGQGFGFKLKFPLGESFFWGVAVRQVVYKKALLDDEEVHLPATISGLDLKALTVNSLILDISFPIGLL